MIGEAAVSNLCHDLFFVMSQHDVAIVGQVIATSLMENQGN
ncbi:MAG: hypothetical protein NZM25_01820 [Leptospiraceae bacterium]|nr:hypothetical protein [Leptospiraceae bacterium]MDW8306913.1 hypothetical protein [Leptospiraceae bacterium]